MLKPTRFSSSPTFKVVDTVRLCLDEQEPEVNEWSVSANERSLRTNERQPREPGDISGRRLPPIPSRATTHREYATVHSNTAWLVHGTTTPRWRDYVYHAHAIRSLHSLASSPILGLQAICAWPVRCTGTVRPGTRGAGTVQGTVKDPTGGVMQAVEVRISNPVTGFSRTATTDASGKYVFNNLPPNPYHIDGRGAGISEARARRRRAHRRADHARLDARAGGRDDRGGGGRSRRGSARARSDRPHGHRSEPDRASCRSRRPSGG